MEEKSKLILFYCLDCKEPIYKGDKYYIDENGFYHHKECVDEKALYFDGFDFVKEGEE